MFADGARRVARVGGRRRIDEVANGGGVQDVGTALEVEQVRQGHRRCVRDDQRHVPVRAPAQLLADKPGERLGITFPLVHVCRGQSLIR